ncbi:MAG: hypothetical protein KUG73_11275 [Pseudomonadales bacterium]|nr:hypothetical protein [Pseudomonadales bacterium]
MINADLCNIVLQHNSPILYLAFEDVRRVTLVDAVRILQRTAFIKHTAKIPLSLDNAPKAIQKLGSHIVDLDSSIIELATTTPDPTILLNKNASLWNTFFVGTSIQGNSVAINIKKTSRIIISVSDMNSGIYTGFAHGDYREKNTTLDDVIRKTK